MSKWAKLHAKISESYDFADACNEDPRAGLLFVLGIAHADVYGVLVGDPRLLVGRVFGLVKVTETEAANAVDTLVKAGLVVRYEDDRGRPYLWFPRYSEHQSIEWVRIGPPEHPLPPEWELPQALIDACQRKNSKDEFVASDSLRRWVATYPMDRSKTSRRPVADQSPLDVDTDTDTDTVVDSAPARNGNRPLTATGELLKAINNRIRPTAGANGGLRLCRQDASTEEAQAERDAWATLLAHYGEETLLGLVAEADMEMSKDSKGRHKWAPATLIGHRDKLEKRMAAEMQVRGSARPKNVVKLEGWPADLNECDLFRRLTEEEVDALAASPDWSRLPPLRSWLHPQQVERVEDRHQELIGARA